MWQDLTLGETICHTLSGFLAHNLERLVTEDAKALQPGVRVRVNLRAAILRTLPLTNPFLHHRAVSCSGSWAGCNS